MSAAKTRGCGKVPDDDGWVSGEVDGNPRSLDSTPSPTASNKKLSCY
jgi:hypothetical protein